MRKLLIITMALFLGLNFAQADGKTKTTKTVCFKSNMDCSNCENTITEYLKFEKGVKDLKVDHVSNTIKVDYVDGKNSDEGLAKAVEKKGYKAEKISQEQYEIIVSDSQSSGHDHSHENHGQH